MPKKIHGLGRGLDALLPENEESAKSAVQEIAVREIDPNPDQPRRTFTEESLAQLAQSIKEQGVLQPVLVVPGEFGRYTLVAGERRWRAARKAGLETVPCIVRDLDMTQQMEIALIENLQREDLNPLEVAQGIRALMQQCGYTQEQVAQRLSKSRPSVANLLRLLTLPDEVTEMIREGVLSAGHARVLAGLDTKEEQLALAQETVEKAYSVRQLEAVAAERRNPPAVKPAVQPAKRPLPVELTDLQNRIREAVGFKVTLTGTDKKGKIVLQYTTREELERFSEMIDKLNEE